MRLVLRVLGVELIDIDLSTDTPTADPDMSLGGTVASTPLGYARPEPDPRYEYADE